MTGVLRCHRWHCGLQWHVRHRRIDANTRRSKRGATSAMCSAPPAEAGTSRAAKLVDHDVVLRPELCKCVCVRERVSAKIAASLVSLISSIVQRTLLHSVRGARRAFCGFAPGRPSRALIAPRAPRRAPDTPQRRGGAVGRHEHDPGLLPRGEHRPFHAAPLR